MSINHWLVGWCTTRHHPHSPVGQGGQREVEARHPLLAHRRHRRLHLAAVLPALVRRQEENVATELQVVSPAAAALGATEAHLLDEDREAVERRRQEELKVAAEHIP